MYQKGRIAMYKIFLVEDDPGIAKGIAQLAESWGLAVHIAPNYACILTELIDTAPQLVILDITLPLYDGFYWCREIRKVSDIPILFISSAADNMNIVMAMNLGADDFITKPFNRSVFMAKLQALLRRCYDYTPAMPLLSHRGAILNTADQTLRYGETEIELTKNEYKILYCLLEQKGQIVSRERLMQRLWETDIYLNENTLNVNVNRLRKKPEAAGLSGYIETKFGIGYLIPIPKGT